MDCWVYMLRCSDGSYYVGSARYSLDRRIGQHQSGELGGYTSTRRPVELVWSEDFYYVTDAIRFERQLKGWSRAKKEALIRGDFAEISRLARRRPSSFETAASRRHADAIGPQDEEKELTARITLILARADNGVIGAGGALPWRLPDDLRRFKQLTLGKPCIMGRKTWDSLPKKPLPGRTNIVVTRNASFAAEGAVAARSFDEAIAVAMRESPAEIVVIGGADIFAAAMAQASRIELTEVHASPEGDVRMPAFSSQVWRETAREAPAPSHSYVTLERIAGTT